LEELIKVLKSFGVFEDLPKSKKHLNYEKVDLKSKRILNRLSIFLATNNENINTFFGDILFH